MIGLECKDLNQDDRWLFARRTGEVVLADEHTARRNKGGHWRFRGTTGSTGRLESIGAPAQRRWLDGHTVYGNVYLVAEGEQETRSGTAWRIHDASDVFSQSAERVMLSSRYPPEIAGGISGFYDDHPAGKGVAFIMMEFGGTSAHRQIIRAIKATLIDHGVVGVRADDKQYHSDLYWNVITYMHGCDFGIAVLERIEADAFNPNVAFEIGYMTALGKPVCLLRDRTITALQTDLHGKLYCSFDPQHPAKSIKTELGRWLSDRAITRTAAG